MSIRSKFKYLMEQLSQGFMNLSGITTVSGLFSVVVLPGIIGLFALLSLAFPPVGIVASIAFIGLIYGVPALLGIAIGSGILGYGFKAINDLVASPEEPAAAALDPQLVEELNGPNLYNQRLEENVDPNPAVVEDVPVMPAPLANAVANADENGDANANDLRTNLN